MKRFIILLLYLMPVAAQADYMEVGSRVLCNDRAAIIQFSSSYNGAPFVFPELTGSLAEVFVGATERPKKECNLGTSDRPHIFRAKLGEFQKHHWGACGAGQRNFMSLWIAGHKIFSRKTVYDGCDWEKFSNIDAVMYTERTLLLCSSQETSGIIQPDTGRNMVCINVNETYRAGLSKPIDEVEYPLDGSQRHENHVVLLVSKQDKLCSILFDQFAQNRNLTQIISDNPKQFAPVPWPWSEPVTTDVDINNDGLSDLIRLGIVDKHGVDQSVVMVRDGRDRDRLYPDPPKAFDRRVLYSGETLFSHDRTAYASNSDGRRPSVIMSPFIWQDQTYVMMHTYFMAQSPKWAVYQLQPDHSINEICVLDRVPINY